MTVVLLCFVSIAVLMGTVSATFVTLELEAADDSDTDTGVVSFTFTTGENATTADVQDTFYSTDGGSVTFEFDEWEEVNGFSSGSQSQFSVEDNTQYRISYTVEASSGATEGTYNFSPSATVNYEDRRADNVGQLLTAEVEILEPSLGTITDKTIDAKFLPEDDDELTRTLSVDIDNTGDGYMDIDDISVNGEPTYMNVRVDSQPNQIDGLSSENLLLDIEVDDSISEGEKSFDVTVSHTAGPSETFEVTVDVIKPPAAGVEESTVDLGEILVGESKSDEITITERGGYDSISGLSDLFRGTNQGSISFPGLSDLSVNSGGSATQEVTVETNDNADQGEQLEWRVGFEPSDPDGIETDDSVLITAEVIYPPYYEDIALDNSDLVFDEPRDEVDVFEDDVTVTITNGGDQEMDIQSVDATVQHRNIDVEVLDDLRSIAPRSSDEITLGVSASPDTPEGEWTLDVQVAAEELTTVPGEETGTTTVESTVSIEHETELSLRPNDLDAGEIIVTERSTEVVTVAERLGYNSIEDFSIEPVAGPDQGWLTIIEQPSELAAGEEKPFTAGIVFDTTAELYETYQWEYEVSGSNIETETITIEAVPEPVDFSDTVNELQMREQGLSGEAAAVAGDMADALVELEEMLQTGEGDADRNDITVLVSAGSSTILLLDAIEGAEEHIDAGDREAAQEELVRASAAFNTLALASEDVNSNQLRPQIEEVRDNAEVALSELIDRQEEHFLNELEEPDTSVLKEAQTQRALSRLAELAGDEQRATELREDAEESFETYSELISNGNEDYIAAQELHEELDDDVFLSLGGQKLFLMNSLSTYNSKSAESLDKYDSAIEKFEEAGATERANAVAEERAEIASEYETAYLLSLTLGVILGLLLLAFIAWEIIALYRYRIDAEESVSGDFLLPWSETES